MVYQVLEVLGCETTRRQTKKEVNKKTAHQKTKPSKKHRGNRITTQEMLMALNLPVHPLEVIIWLPVRWLHVRLICICTCEYKVGT